MKNETGRSMVEMIMVLALMGILTIGGIMSYKSAQNQSKANDIHELVSIASLNGLTKMKNYSDAGVWKAIGKEKVNYSCVSSLSVNANGAVTITFSGCDKVKKILLTQWGSSNVSGSGNTYTYTPPKDDE